MFETLRRFGRSTKAAAGGLVAGIIGLMVATIVGVGVAIPVIANVTTDAGLTGTVATIVNLIPLMIGVVIIVAGFSMIRYSD